MGVAVWGQGDLEEEYGGHDNQGGEQAKGAEATDNIVLISSSRRGDEDGCNQGSSFVALHVLLVQETCPGHDELEEREW